jgi:hypothetical protein
MSGTVINLDDEKLLRSYDRIGKEIVDYIDNMGLSGEVEIARRIYFGKYIDFVNPSKENLSYKPFIQWLIFSYKLGNGLSLIDCVYNNYTGKTKTYELDALKSLRNTYESLYKVYSIDGEKIFIKDVFSGVGIYIWDLNIARSIKRYCGIFARVTNFNSKAIPIPGYSVMTNSFLKEAEEYILNKYREYNKLGAYNSVHNFINSNSLILHRYFLQYVI